MGNILYECCSGKFFEKRNLVDKSSEYTLTAFTRRSTRRESTAVERNTKDGLFIKLKKSYSNEEEDDKQMLSLKNPPLPVKKIYHDVEEPHSTHCDEKKLNKGINKIFRNNKDLFFVDKLII
jgi:CO dehydrogenase/acetyl-CoA synthase alpha subunit